MHISKEDFQLKHCHKYKKRLLKLLMDLFQKPRMVHL